MRKIVLLASVCLVSWQAWAQGVIKFEKEEHDFGDIKEGVVAEYTFKFKNTGNAPIVISNVQASCGCTTPEWPKEPVMPNETAIIKASYNSKSRPGNFFKTITITSNANEPTKVIKIKGNVIMPEQPANPQGSLPPSKLPKLELHQKELNIGKMQVGSIVSKKVNFKNIGEAPLTIRSLSSSCGCVTLKQATADVLPDGVGEFELVYRPLKPSVQPEVVHIITDNLSFIPTLILKSEVVESIVSKSIVQEVKTNPMGW